jgi:hypothetical protein
MADPPFIVLLMCSDTAAKTKSSQANRSQFRSTRRVDGRGRGPGLEKGAMGVGSLGINMGGAFRVRQH